MLTNRRSSIRRNARGRTEDTAENAELASSTLILDLFVLYFAYYNNKRKRHQRNTVGNEQWVKIGKDLQRDS